MPTEQATPASADQNRDVVLVTGASGFIGAAVVRRLGQCYKIVGLDRAGPPNPPAPATAVEIDLASDLGVRRALDAVREAFGNRIASVVHLAAYYDITGEPNPLYDEITVQGTRRLIDALEDFEVGQFIFASTMLVHRATDSPEERITEESPIDPSWPYPESKVRTETMLHDRHGMIPVVYLRVAGVYEDEGHQPFITQQIARIYEHRLIAHLYPGMLCAGQSFVHLDDLTDAIERLVDRRDRLPPELPLLVGEPESLGYEKVQDIIGQALHGEDWDTLRIPQPVAKAGAWVQDKLLGEDSEIKPWMVEASNDHYVLDISRARQLLGWEPQHRLRTTLPKMVAALKRDPAAWYAANKLNPSLVAWYGQRPGNPKHKHGSRHEDIPAKENQAAEGMTVPDGHHHGTPAGTDPSSGGDHMAMMDADSRKRRWAHYANIGLGAWLAASPLVYDAVTSGTVAASVRAVTLERNLPPIDWRADMLMGSDVASGALLMLFGLLSLSRRTAWFGQWAACLVGIWLLFAPLIFWSPSAAQCQNDLLVGTLAIAFSVLVPMMPGMGMAGMMDPKSIPPGWTYGPSTDAQRLPIALLGLIGLLISRMLTAYQLGHVDGVWEPFFSGALADPRNGTEEIITSDVSKAWPIPDAGLGAVSYTFEILMAVMGTRDRWRTMPWMVTFFGILVIPLGVISIYFIIIQPIVIGTWSTPALIAGLAMLVMIPFALDEVIAMGQFLNWARCRGKPLIKTFFQGDAVEQGEEDPSDALASPAAFWADATRGITLPWQLAASIALGASLMLSRLTFGTIGAMANSDHIAGALIITVSIIATAEVARALRFLNIATGLWIIAASVFLGGGGLTATVSDVAIGFLVILLNIQRGKRSNEHYAGWDKYIV